MGGRRDAFADSRLDDDALTSVCDRRTFFLRAASAAIIFAATHSPARTSIDAPALAGHSVPCPPALASIGAVPSAFPAGPSSSDASSSSASSRADAPVDGYTLYEGMILILASRKSRRRGKPILAAVVYRSLPSRPQRSFTSAPSAGLPGRVVAHFEEEVLLTNCSPSVFSTIRQMSMSILDCCEGKSLLGFTVHFTPISTPSLGPRLRRVHQSVGWHSPLLPRRLQNFHIGDGTCSYRLVCLESEEPKRV